MKHQALEITTKNTLFFELSRTARMYANSRTRMWPDSTFSHILNFFINHLAVSYIIFIYYPFRKLVYDNTTVNLFKISR